MTICSEGLQIRDSREKSEWNAYIFSGVRIFAVSANFFQVSYRNIFAWQFPGKIEPMNPWFESNMVVEPVVWI